MPKRKGQKVDFDKPKTEMADRVELPPPRKTLRRLILDRIPRRVHRSLRNLMESFRRGGIRVFLHWLAAGHFIARRRIARFLSSGEPRRVQFGGGRHVKDGPDWLNCDIVAGEVHANAKHCLPFPNASIDLIFTEQFIEHLDCNVGRQFTMECERVLKPGGVVRHSTPDLELVIAIYQGSNPEVSTDTAIERHHRLHRRTLPPALCGRNLFFNDLMRSWGHRHIYDRETMQRLLEEAGFVNIQWTGFGESCVPDRRGLERHAGVDWMERGMSMFCEAYKPLQRKTEEI